MLWTNCNVHLKIYILITVQHKLINITVSINIKMENCTNNLDLHVTG